MTISNADAERIAREGVEALRAGKYSDASALLGQIAESGRANVQIWLLLAHSARLAGDRATSENAADEVLARDNRNIRALILKGDARVAANDGRGASGFYTTALKLSANLDSVPGDLAPELDRAEKSLKAISEGAGDRLKQHLEAQGFSSGGLSPRFEESIDLLLGRKQVYFQQPGSYYFPRLPQIQYYEREEFDWVEGVEAATDDILAELSGVLGRDELFRPYLQSKTDRPSYDFHGLLDNPDWSTLYLWENGGPVEANVKLFPRTFEVMQTVPLPHITARAPSILFSLLKAGARIEAHNGMINTRLICHLPLIVPPNCGFRVGNEVRTWEVGKLIIFDDTIEHEAWNDSDEDRVVLIFDVWRPELTLDERKAVTAIFEAIDS